MTSQEKQRIKVEIISSISIVLLLSMVITLIDSCYQHIINIRDIVNKDNVLMTFVTISGFMLGFLITTFTLKLDQLDNKIEKHAEAINSIIFTDQYKNLNTTESQINASAESHLQTLDGLDHKNFTKLFNDYKGLCLYRLYNKNWTWYPMIWNIIIIILSLLLLLLGESFKNYPIYVYLLSMTCFSAIWAVYLSISFVSDFLENAFINPKQNS